MTSTNPGATNQHLGWKNNPTDLALLADEIFATHHARLRSEIPRLRQLAELAMEKDGATHRPANTLPAMLREFEDEIVFHLLKEEQMLFPRIRSMARLRRIDPSFHRPKSIRSLIELLEREHRGSDMMLANMRLLTNDFQLRADGSEAYRSLMVGLRELAQDMQEHVHKEDDILFPAAIALETELTANN